MASTAADSHGGAPSCSPGGSAASSGNAGSWPSAAPVGATIVPVPNAKPGPSVNAIAHRTALGR